MSKVRVRFAPSPTGFFHIGSARTALFNWLYARHTEGTFILRIEDTDRERNTEEALQVLLHGMRWLGLDWDEGPETGGPCAPYFQSQRQDLYREWLEKLRATGRTYEREGAVWFRLEGERTTEFDAHLGREVEKVKAAPMIIEDAIRGRVERAEEKDFVIFRANGEPVFHFVNVVDDITMGVTHVIRGEDHLSNTSKHCELFNAFGVPQPVFAHIPLILKSSGPGKMSKRDQGALVEEYERRHFLPEALRNYLCLLGWSPKDDREIMPIAEIIARFDLAGISKSNARFDEKKLSHMNAEYVRALAPEVFARLARPLLAEAGLPVEAVGEERLQAILGLFQPKVASLEDVPGYTAPFFTEDYPVDEKAREKIWKKGEPAARLREFRAGAEGVDRWEAAGLEALVNGLAAQHGVSTGDYIHPGRWAVSGRSSGPGFYELLSALGKETVRRRLDRVLRAENGA